MVSSLLLVLGMIALIVYGARRFLGLRMGAWRPGGPIRVLSRSYLGVKKEVALIEVGGEYLLLGITPDSISLLTRFDKPPFPLEAAGPDPGARHDR